MENELLDDEPKSGCLAITERLGCLLSFFIILFIVGLAALPFLILTGILSNP